MGRMPTQNPASRRVDWFALTLTACFAAWVLFVCFHHEVWRDEADVWLAARDMGPLQLFHWLGGAGTTGLWYFMLMPLAKLGLPVMSMILLHAAIAIAVAGIIAFRAPFPPIIRALLVFSYYFSCEYAVIARSYALTGLLLFLVAVVWTSKVKRWRLLGALLFLLCNTNVHGFMIAGAIGVAVVIELVHRREFTRSAMIGAGTALVGAAIAIVQLLPPPHAIAPQPEHRWPVIRYSACESLLPHVPHYPRDPRLHRLGRLAPIWSTALAWAAMLVLAGVCWSVSRNRSALIILGLAWLALIYVFVFKWYAGERHAGLLFLLIIFVLWISKFDWSLSGSASDPLPARIIHGFTVVALVISLCISCLIAAAWSWREVNWDFSGSKEAAAFIRNQPELKGMPIATGAELTYESLLPYLPGRSLWYSGRRTFGTYTDWNRDWKSDNLLSQREVLDRVQNQFPSGGNLLLVAEKPLSHPESAGYRLLFHNSHRIFEHDEENFYLYVRPPGGAR